MLLELAFSLPMVLILMVGGVELGGTWMADNRVEGAVFQSARMGASAGSRVEADRDVLVALRASLPSGLLARVDRVVIYRADTPTTPVPAACVKPVGSTDETGASTCNTYTGATLRTTTATSMTGFGGGLTAKDRYWKPSTRKDTLSGPPDNLGVWVRTSRAPTVGGGFGSFTITASAISRLQPDLSG